MIDTTDGANRYEDQADYEEEDPSQSTVALNTAPNAGADAETPVDDSNGPQEALEDAKEEAKEILEELEQA